MPDYKEMYLIMMRAAEQAQNVLIEAQRKCEELYVEADDQEERPAPGAGSSTSKKTQGGAPLCVFIFVGKTCHCEAGAHTGRDDPRPCACAGLAGQGKAPRLPCGGVRARRPTQ